MNGVLAAAASFRPGTLQDVFSSSQLRALKTVEASQEGEATLRLPDGVEITLPLLVDASGSRFIDVRKLQPTTGICTFDPGFGSTAACESSITYIDGNKGILLYRG
jgi:citrate synthase